MKALDEQVKAWEESLALIRFDEAICGLPRRACLGRRLAHCAALAAVGLQRRAGSGGRFEARWKIRAVVAVAVAVAGARQRSPA